MGSVLVEGLHLFSVPLLSVRHILVLLDSAGMHQQLWMYGYYYLFHLLNLTLYFGYLIVCLVSCIDSELICESRVYSMAKIDSTSHDLLNGQLKGVV